MDGLIQQDNRVAARSPEPRGTGQAWLPPEKPMLMPVQDPDRLYRDPQAPRIAPDLIATPTRLLCISALIAIVAYFAYDMYQVLAPQGISVLEGAVLVFFVLSMVGIAIGFVNAVAGIIAMAWQARRRKRYDASFAGLNVALLLPIYNEAPDLVFGNAMAMLKALGRDGDTRHSFSFYFLSDTNDPAIAAQEARAFGIIQRRFGSRIPVYYRRREENIERKSGNIKDWVTRWGDAHDAMLVLDADSVMSRAAIVELCDALGDDPGAGLVQSVPQLVKTKTGFARLQQFAAAVYGPVLAAGFNLWARGEGNYWGHNAIIRTRVFAACAGLPKLSGRPPFGGHVLSHDFIEAALLRRAGWRVKLITSAEGSFEETPPNLVDHILRDRRWCQGNLQHLSLLGMRGLHPISRFHLLHGAMAYLSATLWLGFLLAGLLVALSAGDAPVNYFPEPYSFISRWPVMDSERALSLLLLTFAMLLTPKLLGILTTIAGDPSLKKWGGYSCFFFSIVTEILLSALLAPALMIQQSILVMRILCGMDVGWKPQRRQGTTTSMRDLLRFHRVETALGIVLFIGMIIAIAPIELAPIAVGWLLAAPLSAYLQRPLPTWIKQRALLATPVEIDAPAVLRDAKDFSHQVLLQTGAA